jgi:hypothetical protein
MDWHTLEREQEAAAEQARLNVLRGKSTDELGKVLAELDRRGEHGAADEIAKVIAERGERNGG